MGVLLRGLRGRGFCHSATPLGFLTRFGLFVNVFANILQVLFFRGFYAKIELIKSTKNPLKSSSDFLNRYCNIKIIILSLIISFYQKYTNNENQRIFLQQNIALKNVVLYAKFITREKNKI